MAYLDQDTPRIFRNETIHLRRHEDRTILGPSLADVGMRRKTVLYITEALFFLAFVIGIAFFVLWGEIGFQFIVGAVMLFSAIQFAVMAGLMYTVWTTMTREVRLTLFDNGTITVKNERNEDVTLRPEGDVAFICVDEADRDGQDVYDVFLQYNREQYYLLSGRERDEMERLRETLEKSLQV